MVNQIPYSEKINMTRDKTTTNGENIFHFLRMSQYIESPQLPGIPLSGLLNGSFLIGPSLVRQKVDNKQFNLNKGIGIKEEYVQMEVPGSLANLIKVQIQCRKQGSSSIEDLPKVEYYYFGIRSGLENFPIALQDLKSKLYENTLKEIFRSRLQKFRKESEGFVKLPDERSYRATFRDCLVDLSFYSDGPYPRLSLDIFSRSTENLQDVPASLGIKRDLKELLLNNRYESVIMVDFSRSGFGHDVDFANLNPKDFRTTDKLTRNIVF